MATLLQYIHLMEERLAAAVGPDEARAMARAIVRHVMGYAPVDAVLHAADELSPFRQEQMRTMVERVADGGEPLQYVLGRAHWRGCEYRVSDAVLIPRPETAGLVDLAADRLRGRKDLRVLDVGTGSGIIAIALVRELPFASVTALDVSPRALAVARANAADKGVEADWLLADVLRCEALPAGPYDLVVSNPPYVTEAEKTSIDPRVVLHEPAEALYVPDADPLLFYRAIADKAARALTAGGWLMFEINPLFASQTRSLVASLGYRDPELHRDYRGRPRYLTAQWMPK